VDIFDTLLDPIGLPRMFRIRQRFDRPVVADPAAAMIAGLRERGALDAVRPGMKVAITAGSRGIVNLPLLIKTFVLELKRRGAEPFIIPAMGSHGGATAEGQRDMLVGMGISEEYVGAPIRSSMEVVEIGTSANGLPVYVDKYAWAADGIVVINRIKPHVAFRGPYESGLMKMLAIGLGKQKGAETCHKFGFGKMAENVSAVASVTLEKAKILCAVGLLENSYREICRVEVLRRDEIKEREPDLQAEAKRLEQRLYFDKFDVLIMDEIGKDISGTGFDTNVVGRYHTPYISGGPTITRVAVLDLTDRSHGNANGLGIVDFTTMRAYAKFKFDQTYPNALTSTVPMSVKIPMVLRNDRHAVQAAIKTCNISRWEDVKLVRIKNTMHLEEIEISESLLSEARNNPGIEILGGPYELPFNKDGNLF
jgi:hypothetical protein